LQFSHFLSANRLSPGSRLEQQKTACQYYFLFPPDIAPNHDKAKVNGKNIHQRLREHCNFSTFEALVVLNQAGATSSN